MIRTIVAVLAIAPLAGSAAQAQSTPAEIGNDNRYTFDKVEDGYLRLDGRTGQLATCTRKAVGWICQAAPDERTALEAEVARLQEENVALKQELLARNPPLPGTPKPESPIAKPEQPSLQVPSDADLNKMMAFIEKVWRRLVEMIVTMQKDMLNKS
jgi:hypothetical protein